jgi:hypothetical protein
VAKSRFERVLSTRPLDQVYHTLGDCRSFVKRKLQNAKVATKYIQKLIRRSMNVTREGFHIYANEWNPATSGHGMHERLASMQILPAAAVWDSAEIVATVEMPEKSGDVHFERRQFNCQTRFIEETLKARSSLGGVDRAWPSEGHNEQHYTPGYWPSNMTRQDDIGI